MHYYINIILGWAILFAFLYGVGDLSNMLLKKLFKFSFNTLPYKMLIGFCISLLLLGIIQLFSSLNIVVLIILLVMCSFSIGSLIFKLFRKKFKYSVLPNLPLILISVSSLFLILIFLNRTLGNTFLYDQGHYYLQILQWYEKYPIILGLSNIHGRLGFNNSSFLLFSLFDNLNLLKYDSSWVNSGLALLTIFFSLWNLYRVIISKIYDISKIFLGFIWLPICIFLFSNETKSLISFSPDNYVFYLELIIVGILLSFRSVSEVGFKKKFFLVLLLASTLFSIKLSGAMFGLASVIWLVVTNLPRFKSFKVGIGIASLVVLVALLRSFLMSGYPVYPSSLIDLNPKWSVTKEVANDELCFVKSWARERRSDCNIVLKDWNWINTWFKEFRSEGVWPYLLIVSVFLTIFLFIKKKLSKDILGIYLILLVSLLYWFFLAPDLRFALGIFWSFILLSGSILISKYKSIVWYVLFMNLIIFAVLLSNISLKEIDTKNINWDIQYLKDSSFETTDSGIKINLPRKGEDCWNEEIPCTPYFDSRLKYLDESKGVKGGFYIGR